MWCCADAPPGVICFLQEHGGGGKAHPTDWAYKGTSSGIPQSHLYLLISLGLAERGRGRDADTAIAVAKAVDGD